MDVASSAVAFLSIAIELASGLKKGYFFWQSIDEAPASIRSIAKELKSLSAVLERLSSSSEEKGNAVACETLDVLEICKDLISEILAITNKLEAKISTSTGGRRKWAAMKGALKEKKILKLQNLLERTKTTLNLALQIDSRYQMNGISERNNQMLARIDQQLSRPDLNLYSNQTSQICILFAPSGVAAELKSVQHEIDQVATGIQNPIVRSGFEKSMSIALREVSRSFHEKEGMPSRRHDSQMDIPALVGSSSFVQRKRYLGTSTTVTNNFFGRIVWSTRSYVLCTSATMPEPCSPEDEEGSEMMFRMTPAPWLVRLGLKYQVRFSVSHVYGEWKKAFRTFYIMPSNSLVFKLCAQGNIDGLRTMFSMGEASPDIINENGETLLHVATRNLRLDICQMLWISMSQSVFRDDFYKERLDIVSLSVRKMLPEERRIAVLKLFLASADFEDPDDHCWHMLQSVIFYHEDVVSETKGQTNAPIFNFYSQVVSLMAPKFALQAGTTELLENARLAGLWAKSMSFMDFAVEKCNNKLEITVEPTDFTILQNSILSHDYEHAQFLVERGANTHHVAHDIELSPVEETPTTSPCIAQKDSLSGENCCEQTGLISSRLFKPKFVNAHQDMLGGKKLHLFVYLKWTSTLEKRGGFRSSWMWSINTAIVVGSVRAWEKKTL